MAVAGVAGLEAGRFALSRGRAERLLAVAPVLRRRAARPGEPGAVAVLQTGEGANRVGVGGTQALTPGGWPLPLISPALAVLAAPPSRIAVANTVAAAVRNRMFPPEDDADGAETVLETGRSSARTAPPVPIFLTGRAPPTAGERARRSPR